MLQTQLLDSKLTEKNMKQFHRNQASISTKNVKKGRKLRKNHSVETCKCFTPFVKLHWWDCPEINKPCPIHGNVLYQNFKPEKAEPDQNVTVSFHPSSRTEKLFEPVKTLLAQCDPDTKINFQYYSPRSFTDKENLKHQLIQTSFEDLKKNLDNNVSVEKTKSFVSEKTNKMKKLKECFHSPCNSITQKYPSPTSARRNFNEILSEEATQPWHNFFRSDTNCGPNTDWFSSNAFGFKNLEKLSGNKKDSDFITVTQHNKDNIISHKIFEIQHRKGLNEIPVSGFPKQPPQFAYSSFNVNYPQGSQKNSRFAAYDVNKKPRVGQENTISENSGMSTSSEGSVYVTPFLLVPPGLELSDTDIIEDESGKRTVASQVDEGLLGEKSKLITKYVQISHDCEGSDYSSDNKMNTVSLQTEVPGRDKCPREVFQQSFESSMDTVSDKRSCIEKPMRKNRPNNNNNNNNNKPNLNSDHRITREESKVKKTTEVQTSDGYQIKEVLITRYNKQTREATCQVYPSVSELQEAGSQGINKSLMTFPSFSNKKTQISQRETSEVSDEGDMHFSKVTKVRELEYEDSNDTIQKRSDRIYSDSDFFERQKGDNSPPENDNGRNSYYRSQQRGQGAPRTEQTPREEKGTSAFSDLSELKRIIYEFFERTDAKGKENETAKKKQGPVNTETMTDNRKSSDRLIKWGNLENKEIQTNEQDSKERAEETGSTQMDGGMKQYRQSVLLDDPNLNKTQYICSFCGREINRFSIHAGTNTEESYAIREKTTIIETGYKEIMKVKKNKEPNNMRKPLPNSNSNIKPIANSKSASSKVLKSTQAQTSPVRSNIPVPVSAGTGSNRNERYKEANPYWDSQEWPQMNSSNSFRTKSSQYNERQQTSSQAFRECMCNELPEIFVSVQESANSHHRTYRMDDMRSNEDPRDRGQKQPNRHFYHVTVNPSWPRDLTNSWKPQEMCYESLKFNPNQKLCYEPDLQQYEAHFPKKIFEQNEDMTKETKECEKPTFPNMERKGKHEAPTKENSAFTRMPFSSASQISMNKNSVYQSKTIKSEESVKTVNHPLGSTQAKIFREDSNDLFTVKSCHMSPISSFTYEGQSNDKILACNVCKSLMLLKINKNEEISYGPKSNGVFSCQNESDERNQPADEVPERQSYEKFALLRENVDEHEEEEYAEKCSNFSDATTKTVEQDFSKDNSESDS